MIYVAAYCRVSTDKEDQANSFESQQLYFRQYIDQHPDWELFAIYADEGITGTSTKKRIAFNRMIEDAHRGKFQLILTKEVSRFSRNILDTIAFTRQLRSIGVGVLFVLDQINTLKPEAEMLLSFLASLAQEESRRTSGRVVWGQTRQMERGVVFGHSLLGYDVTDGKISVNSEGAAIVKLIFHKYVIEQASSGEIARYLTQEGYVSSRGNSAWMSSAVVKILRNEKYVGDLIQKKTYTPDYLSHDRKRNNGEVPLVCIENHHEPIVSRDLWTSAQKRLQRNNKQQRSSSGHSNRYVFSGNILCGECGSVFVARTKCSKNGEKQRRWCCGKAAREGQTSCNVGKLVRDDDAAQMLKTALQHLPIDIESVVDRVTALARDAISNRAAEHSQQREKLTQDAVQIKRKKELAMDSYFSGCISSSDMQTMIRKYDEQLECLDHRLKKMYDIPIKSTGSDETAIRTTVQDILCGKLESDAFYKAILHHLTVYKDRHIELQFQHLPMIFSFSDGKGQIRDQG